MDPQHADCLDYGRRLNVASPGELRQYVVHRCFKLCSSGAGSVQRAMKHPDDPQQKFLGRFINAVNPIRPLAKKCSAVAEVVLGLASLQRVPHTCFGTKEAVKIQYIYHT
ncbi:hypothetical protein AcV5_008641 [Taiwanofungus camphoratus]|nr:hypothetical protein AcV5_008641 [Antrodia cinnamomea]